MQVITDETLEYYGKYWKNYYELSKFKDALCEIAKFRVQDFSPENYNVVIQQIQDIAKEALNV